MSGTPPLSPPRLFSALIRKLYSDVTIPYPEPLKGITVVGNGQTGDVLCLPVDDNRPVFSRAMALAGRMFIETIPQWLAVGVMLSPIFGGCCSNVLNNTRGSLLAGLFAPIIEDPNVATLGEALTRIREASAKLQQFDIFREDGYRVFISDARQDQQQAPAHSERTDLNVAINVKEKSRLVFNAGTDFGNAEGSAYTNAVARNIFGGAESLSINASTGTRTRSAYNVTFSTPALDNPDLRLSLEGLYSLTSKPWASHDEGLTGGNVRLAHRTANGDSHAFTYAGIWRQLINLTATASPTLRADAGDSVKSSLGHTFTRDRRDNPVLPQSGYLIRAISELAGWGPLKGDISFAKYETLPSNLDRIMACARQQLTG